MMASKTVILQAKSSRSRPLLFGFRGGSLRVPISSSIPATLTICPDIRVLTLLEPGTTAFIVLSEPFSYKSSRYFRSSP
jgi:hypothetical protein